MYNAIIRPMTAKTAVPMRNFLVPSSAILLDAVHKSGHDEVYIAAKIKIPNT